MALSDVWTGIGLPAEITVWAFGLLLLAVAFVATLAAGRLREWGSGPSSQPATAAHWLRWALLQVLIVVTAWGLLVSPSVLRSQLDSPPQILYAYIPAFIALGFIVYKVRSTPDARSLRIVSMVFLALGICAMFSTRGTGTIITYAGVLLVAALVSIIVFHVALRWVEKT